MQNNNRSEILLELFLCILIFIFIGFLLYAFAEGNKCFDKCKSTMTSCVIEHYRDKNIVRLPNGQSVMTGYIDIFAIYELDNPRINETHVINDKNDEYWRCGIKLRTDENKYTTICYTYDSFRTSCIFHDLCDRLCDVVLY